MDDIKYTFEQLARLSDAKLDEIFKKGKTPDIDKLLGYEFRGYNTPVMTQLLGIRKFKKGFYMKDGKPFGYNIPVEQNGLKGEWICKPGDDNPKRFGFYSINLPGTTSISDKEPNAALLNYGDGNNGLFEGKLLRDFVVQVYPDNPDLYLGKAYSQLGSKLIMPMFFIIERHRESDLK